MTVATTGDSADEPDGSVTATINAGSGYTISGSQGAATVSVADDDDPPSNGYTPPADLVKDVRSYIAETHLGNIHVNRWKQVLMGLGVETYPGLTAMKSTEAKTYSDKGWKRWDPVVVELKKAEAANAPTLTATPTATPTPKPTATPTPTPTPAISVTGGSGVTEGSAATFTFKASPAPTSDLSVKVSIAQSGDYGVATGAKTVTIPTGGTATLSVPTTGDSVDEPDGSVTATINAGSGYTISGNQGAATVSVSDDDDPPGDLPTLSVLDTTVGEGDILLNITFKLSKPSKQKVSFQAHTKSGSATQGVGFSGLSAYVTFKPGETETVQSMLVYQDDDREGDETLTVELSDPDGATIADGVAVATITDDD